VGAAIDGWLAEVRRYPADSENERVLAEYRFEGTEPLVCDDKDLVIERGSEHPVL
jgi:hypothetical protein